MGGQLLLVQNVETATSTSFQKMDTSSSSAHFREEIFWDELLDNRQQVLTHGGPSVGHLHSFFTHFCQIIQNQKQHQQRDGAEEQHAEEERHV